MGCRCCRAAVAPVWPGRGVNHAIVVDFTPHMGSVLSIGAEAGTARVQPGVVLSELSREARAQGLQFGIDPSTANRATIGGGIGNNSCGAHSGLYGKMADNVVSMEAVLSDGSVVTIEPLDAAALDAKRAQADLEGAIYRASGEIARREAAEIGRRFPEIPRRVSGYNLDAVLKEPGDLTRLGRPDARGVRGHAGGGHRGDGAACPAAGRDGLGGGALRLGGCGGGGGDGGAGARAVGRRS